MLSRCLTHRLPAFAAALTCLTLVGWAPLATDAAGASKKRPSAGDLDGDGRPNGTDRDVDGDGRKNEKDRDVDGDGVKNSRDRNIDGDRLPNWPRDADMDGDGKPNVRDIDPDADGRKWAVARKARVPKGAPKPPPDFFGFVHNEVMASEGDALNAELARAAATGAGIIRQTFDWASIERTPGEYEFLVHDRFVEAMARHGLEVLPVLFNPPPFRSSAPAVGARRGTYAPRSNAEFAQFATLLVQRYGPGGTFWAAHPDLRPQPIRSWQVWNEPNLLVYWPSGVNPGQYAQMLKAVGAAIKQADPGAEIVTAGIPESRSGMPLPRFLKGVIRGGARSAFDTLAINPYATTPEGVYENFWKARRMLDRFKAKNIRIWATELGWATSGPSNPFNAGPLRQVRLITRTFPLLAGYAKRLKIRGVVYYAWRDAPIYEGGKDFWGLHTGLLTLNGAIKPGLAAYRASVAALRLR